MGHPLPLVGSSLLPWNVRAVTLFGEIASFKHLLDQGLSIGAFLELAFALAFCASQLVDRLVFGKYGLQLALL